MKNNRTFLEKLLDGAEVEWKTLDEISSIYGGLTGKGKADFENGNALYVPYKNIFNNIEVDFNNLEAVNVSDDERQYTIKYGDVLFTGSSETAEEAGMSSAVTTKTEQKIYLNSFSFGLRFNDDVELLPEFSKFLFRTLSIRKEIVKSASGVTRFNISKARFKKIKIPIPPLSVQTEIVKILDALTALTSELTSELILRQKQYEYYREKLLNIDEMNKVTELGDVGPVRMCKRILKNQTANSGDIPFYKIGTFGKKPDAYISNELFQEYKQKYSYPKKGDILISASGTIGRTVIFDGENSYFQDSNIVWIDNDETLVLNKYLYHFYKIAKWGIAEGGTIQRLYNDNLKKVKISIPPLKEQHRIVSILDKFETLTNSITEGLPLAIEQSQKRYEYYRELLLNFHNP
ncbi:TPA: restriction endonuclease subunit S [Haemophilus influenzae]|uniref:restriction endonuclease subunit S n=1 Tax=Haemophilus influenzae TaxID=727 RepID=UPI003F7E3EBF